MSNTPAVQAPKSNVEVLKGLLNAPTVKEQFNNALRENTGAFVASIIELYSSSTLMQECKPNEVVMECLKAATLKLPINRSLGFAYVIPYNVNKKNAKGEWEKIVTPQFQLGYKGYIQLAMRTGQYKTINADVVCEGELRKVNKLSGEIQFDGTKTSDKVIGYFCYFELLNGFSKTLYMSTEQIEVHGKKYSKTFGIANGVWKTDFDAMALKTVIRLLLGKYGYLTTEMQGAMANDTEPEDVRDEQVSANNSTKHLNAEEVKFEVVNTPTSLAEGERPASEPANEATSENAPY